VSALRFTVSCVDHDVMERDHARHGWKCAAEGCTAWLPDDEAYRLMLRAPADSPDPVPLVVT
jgi:hypothetical protein